MSVRIRAVWVRSRRARKREPRHRERAAEATDRVHLSSGGLRSPRRTRKRSSPRRNDRSARRTRTRISRERRKAWRTSGRRGRRPPQGSGPSGKSAPNDGSRRSGSASHRSNPLLRHLRTTGCFQRQGGVPKELGPQRRKRYYERKFYWKRCYGAPSPLDLEN